MSLTKTFYNLITGKSSEKESFEKNFEPRPRISREELREFLINNNLQGELLKSVSELKAKYSDLSNYQAVEFLMDHNDRNNH